MAGVFVPRLARIGAFSGLSILGAYGYSKDDEGLQRSAYFWTNVLPIYAHYRATQIWVEKIKQLPDEEQDAYYEPLHDKYSHKMQEIIEHLKGFYIKIGQIGATRSDFLPKQYMRAVSALQDAVPPEGWPRVDATLRRALGPTGGPEEVFEWVDRAPLGSASIGQVHRAKLRATGQVVAVKVMYPGVEGMFRGDIATMKRFCALAQPEHLPALGEIEKQFLTEFDYRREAENLRKVGDNMRRAWGHKVVVPEPIWASEEVLIMSYVEGEKLVDGLRRNAEALARLKGTTAEALAGEAAAAEARGERVEGLSRRAARRLRLYLRLRRALARAARAALAPLGLLRGGGEGGPEETPLPLDTAGLIEDLLEVHGHQVLVDGCFNGDPHPGNILLTKDGKLGLIDYGQVKEITPKQRHTLARLILALAAEDQNEVVRIYTEMGFRTRRMDPDVIYRHCRTIYDNDHRDTLGVNIQLYLEQLQAIDPVVEMPDEYLMAGRVLVLLRGLAYALKYNPQTAKAWSKLARQLVEDNSKT